MKKDKEFIFKKKNVTIEAIMLFFILSVVIFALTKIFYNPLIFLFSGVIPAILAYFQYYELTIIRQFNRFDNGKRIFIRDDCSKLTIVQGNKEITIDRSDIDKVDVFEQKSLGKFGTYNYILIHTNDCRELLITKFTIPLLVYDSALQSFLRKKPRVYHKKTFNYIDKKRFKLC